MSTARLLRSQPVKIVCPGCGAVCEARVEHRDGDPWPTYCHDCERCGYTITESEWEEAGR